MTTPPIIDAEGFDWLSQVGDLYAQRSLTEGMVVQFRGGGATLIPAFVGSGQALQDVAGLPFVLYQPLTTFNVECHYKFDIGRYYHPDDLVIQNSLTNAVKLTIVLNTDTSISIYRGNRSSLIAQTSTGIVSTTTPEWLGVSGVIDPSNGQIQIMVGKDVVYNVSGISTVGDDSTTVFDSIYYGYSSGWHGLDDVIVGSQGFVGESFVVSALATSDGTVNGFTPNPTQANYLNIDSLPIQSTNYNGSNVFGTTDSYLYGAVPRGQIIAVKFCSYMWPSTGGSSLEAGLVLNRGSGQQTLGGGNTSMSSGKLLYSGCLSDNPFTSAPWSQADFNSGTTQIQFGPILVGSY